MQLRSSVTHLRGVAEHPGCVLPLHPAHQILHRSLHPRRVRTRRIEQRLAAATHRQKKCQSAAHSNLRMWRVDCCGVLSELPQHSVSGQSSVPSSEPASGVGLDLGGLGRAEPPRLERRSLSVVALVAPPPPGRQLPGPGARPGAVCGRRLCWRSALLPARARAEKPAGSASTSDAAGITDLCHSPITSSQSRQRRRCQHQQHRAR